MEGQQSEHNEFVSVKQAAPCVVEHHIGAGVKQGLQTDLHGRHESAKLQQNMCNCVLLTVTVRQHGHCLLSMQLMCQEMSAECRAATAAIHCKEGNAGYRPCSHVPVRTHACTMIRCLTSSCSGVGATSSWSASSSRMVSAARPVAEDDPASPAGLQ